MEVKLCPGEKITVKDAEIKRLTAKVIELETSLARVSDIDPTGLICPPLLTHYTQGFWSWTGPTV